MLAKKFKLPIQESLNKKKAFKFLKGEYFNFKIFENQLNHSRFGVIVPKKIFKKSFLRNQFKRLIFQEIQSQKIYLNPGRDCLIIAKPKILKEAENPKIIFSNEKIKENAKKDLKINFNKIFNEKI
mgnify:CR=1 FL=1